MSERAKRVKLILQLLLLLLSVIKLTLNGMCMLVHCCLRMDTTPKASTSIIAYGNEIRGWEQPRDHATCTYM